MKIISRIIKEKREKLRQNDIMSILRTENKHNINRTVDIGYNQLVEVIYDIKKRYGYKDIGYAFTKLKGIKEDICQKSICILKKGKALNKDINIFFEHNIIGFNFENILSSRSFILYKIIAIFYHWYLQDKNIKYNLLTTYNELLSYENEYLNTALEDTSIEKRQKALLQERHRDLLKIKERAISLHNILIAYYDNMNIDDRGWRRELRRLMFVEPRYSRLISSLLCLLSGNFTDIKKDFMRYSKNYNEDYNEDYYLYPFCFIESSFINEYLDNLQYEGIDYYFAVIGKRRKFYQKLTAFINEFQNINFKNYG